MSNTANTRLYKAPLNMVLKIPHVQEVNMVVRRNVYFRRSDKSPYIVVKGRRRDVRRVEGQSAKYEFTEVLQRSR